MSAELDRKVFQNLSYGLYVLTSYDEDRINGQIINSAIQVTHDPVRIAVTVNKKNLTHRYITKSRAFAVSVLDSSTPTCRAGTWTNSLRSGSNLELQAVLWLRKTLSRPWKH